jgi:sugar phosphate isomerase/epimerase
VLVATSSHSFADLGFDDACRQVTDLGYDKVEIWLSEGAGHLEPADVSDDPDRFCARYREATRLTPIAFHCEQDVTVAAFQGLVKAAQILRIAQITVPASPLGTPFNTEIDRLRELTMIASEGGIRLSIKTQIGHLTEDPHTAVELCQAVSGLGLTLDPSHYIAGPNRGKSYDQVYAHVYHVHLRDTTADQLQVKVGLGEIDYSRLINQLRRFKSEIALSVDLVPALIGDEDRELEMRKLRMLLETLL